MRRPNAARWASPRSRPCRPGRPRAPRTPAGRGRGRAWAGSTSSPAMIRSKASKSMRSTTVVAIRRSDIVTSAVGMPGGAQAGEQLLRARAERDRPCVASCPITSSVRWSTMSSTPIRTPASWKIRAESSRPMPTSWSACSCDQVPPNLSTSGVSAAIQYGSVSTRVPSMSHRTAAGAGGVTAPSYRGPCACPSPVAADRAPILEPAHREV